MPIILIAWYFLYFVFLRSEGRLSLGGARLWWIVFAFFGAFFFAHGLYLLAISLGHASLTFGVLGLIFGLVGVVLLVSSKNKPNLLRAVPAVWLLPAACNGMQMGVWADETGNGGGGPDVPVFILFCAAGLLFALSTAAQAKKTRGETITAPKASEITS